MAEPLRVLIVEDSEDDALLVGRELRRSGYDPVVERVDTPEATKSALSTGTWDVVLADYSLPHFSGLDALQVVRETRRDVPFIVVSGTIGEETAVALMKGGARDYIRKDNLARLGAVIERERRETEERRARRRAEAERKLILESAADGICGLDAEGTVTFINPAGARMVGWTAEELVGRPMHETVHYTRPDGTPYAPEECPVLMALRTESVRRAADELFWRRDGTSFPVEYVVSPVREPGESVRAVLVFQDITERRRAIEDREAARQRLIQAEREKKRFYCEVIRVVTQDRFHLVDDEDIPTRGRQVLDMPLGDAESYAALRRELRRVAQEAGMPADAAQDLVLASGEAATNAIKHATDARCRVYVTDESVVARISDHGQGIRPESLPASILLPGFSSKVSLGMGYTIMLQVMDRVWLATSPEGTVVQLEKRLRPAEASDEPLLPAAWANL